MTDFDLLQLGTFLVFIASCAYFSYRSGFKEGIETGATGVIDLLHDQGIIAVTVDESGDEIIHSISPEK